VVEGRLYVVGGLRWAALGGLAVATAIYDPSTNVWYRGAPIPLPRDHLTAQGVGGIVYAIGGRPVDPDRNYGTVQAYDPKTDQWAWKDSMPTPRGGLGSAVLDGKIHVFGGESRSGVFAEHEVYDPATNHWSTELPLPTARHGLGVAEFGGKIYVIGGGPRPAYGQTDVVEVFTP
jgi:N-acetylneuraminic acid mutarotase